MSTFWKNKKVLVTGAAGFIGSHAVSVLIEKGAIVTAVVSPKSNKKRIHGESFTVQADLLNPNDCFKVAKGQDIILNFAAMDGSSTFKQKHAAEILQTNTKIVLNMLESAVKNNVGRFLLMSSIEVYPKSAKSLIKEDYSLKENFSEDATGYAWSKRFGEIAAKMYTKEYGLNIAIARMGNVYGPGDYVSPERGRVIPIFITKILEGSPITLIGKGSVKRSFLYITDAVEALLTLVEKYPQCDPINIVGSEYVSIRSLALLIQRLLKKKAQLQMVDSSQKEKNKIVSNKKAKKIINFQEKTTLKQGLTHIINSLQ